MGSSLFIFPLLVRMFAGLLLLEKGESPFRDRESLMGSHIVLTGMQLNLIDRYVWLMQGVLLLWWLEGLLLHRWDTIKRLQAKTGAIFWWFILYGLALYPTINCQFAYAEFGFMRSRASGVLDEGASGIIFLIIKGEGVRIRKMFIPGLYQHVTDLLFNVEIAMYINYFIDLINQIVGEGVRKMFFPGSVPAYYRSPVQYCWEGLRTEPSVKEDEIVLDDSEGVLGTVREDWVLGAPREDWVLDRDGVLSMWLSTAEER
ncbi:PREDICTED: uncharacterized protein LOC101300119 [Fragaria vesca subsp. vesca]